MLVVIDRLVIVETETFSLGFFKASTDYFECFRL